MMELKDRARRSVSMATILAVMLNKAMEDRYPATRDIQLAHWNRVVTAAGMTVVNAALGEIQLTDQERFDLTFIMCTALEAYDSAAEAIWNECGRTVTATLYELRHETDTLEERADIFATTLGGWMVTRLFGTFPAEEWALPLSQDLGWAVWEEMCACWD
jgi:hypothetical protein